jgi:hypothetical protein
MKKKCAQGQNKTPWPLPPAIPVVIFRRIDSRMIFFPLDLLDAKEEIFFAQLPVQDTVAVSCQVIDLHSSVRKRKGE